MGRGSKERPATTMEVDGDGDEDKGYDVVTRIQNEVANLSSMYYNFTGGLQEMAPPMSVRSEPVKVESDTSVAYNAKELATQIVSAHKKIDALIDTLEIPAGEDDDHIKSIVSLQETHERMKETYDRDLKHGGQVFDTLQDCYSILAEYQLKHGKFK